jgi:hypothetical protein
LPIDVHTCQELIQHVEVAHEASLEDELELLHFMAQII